MNRPASFGSRIPSGPTTWALALRGDGACPAAATRRRSRKTQTVGAHPTLPPPTSTLIPTVNIAPAKGWPAGVMPAPASGLSITALARGLDHPRWLHVLPNGDVLVAETNAPERPERSGPKTFVMNMVMKRAGAAVPSANRITLLRDADGDGVAEITHRVPEGSELAVRHGAGRQRSVTSPTPMR